MHSTIGKKLSLLNLRNKSVKDIKAQLSLLSHRHLFFFRSEGGIAQGSLPPYSSTDFCTTFKMMNFSATQQKIPLPTIEEIKNNLSFSKNCALVCSGPGSYAYKARQWAKRKEAGHMVLSQLWKDKSYPSLWQNNEDLSEEFFALASRAVRSSQL